MLKLTVNLSIYSYELKDNQKIIINGKELPYLSNNGTLILNDTKRASARIINILKICFTRTCCFS